MAVGLRARSRRLLRTLELAVTGSDWYQALFGSLIVGYYRLVYRTGRVTVLTPDLIARIEATRPFVLALWHGEALMVPFAVEVRWPTSAMTSRSKDGGIVARVLRAVNIEPIRASGRGRGAGSGRKVSSRGGVVGLIQARDALRAGSIVCMTADVPKTVPYQAGEGIVALARLAGRPIVPVAAVNSRQIRVKSWDRMTLALPFGRIAVAMGEPISVAADADADAIEAARRAVEVELTRLHRLAYAAVGKPGAALLAGGRPDDGHG
jgi:lysophospholipid acyltransferase (LPLAT)-like uncharacterized protein